MRALYFTLLFSFYIVHTFAQRQIVFTTRADIQTNNYGFQFVEQISNLVNKEVKYNNLKIYNSPNKTKIIPVLDLEALENQTGLLLSKANQILIYEIWNNSGKVTNREIYGLSFVNDSKKDEIISFGFVPFKSLLPILEKTEVITNADGMYGLNWLQVFEHNLYDREMISIDNAPITPRQEKKITEDYFVKRVYTPSTSIPINKKRIHFKIDNNQKSSDEELLISNSLYYYILDNIAALQKIVSPKSIEALKNGAHIQKIFIVQEWININNRIDKNTSLIGIKLDFLNDIDYISTGQINAWNLQIDNVKWLNYLESSLKTFPLIKINYQELVGKQYSEAYSTLESNWTNTNEILNQLK